MEHALPSKRLRLQNPRLPEILELLDLVGSYQPVTMTRLQPGSTKLGSTAGYYASRYFRAQLGRFLLFFPSRLGLETVLRERCKGRWLVLSDVTT
ncbi:hypothetical protein ACSS6W_000923 [Trichoderma asperelloides]